MPATQARPIKPNVFRRALLTTPTHPALAPTSSVENEIASDCGFVLNWKSRRCVRTTNVYIQNDTQHSIELQTSIRHRKKNFDERLRALALCLL